MSLRKKAEGVLAAARNFGRDKDFVITANDLGRNAATGQRGYRSGDGACFLVAVRRLCIGKGAIHVAKRLLFFRLSN